jgi:shikimate dehydrogenase
MTQRYGIVAHPVGHSLSPTMHNAAFKALGIEATYEAFDIAPDSLGAFVNEQKEIAGLSVSLPHKTAIIEHLDGIDQTSQRIGAVNTVYKKDGQTWGTNTDAPGFLNALKAVVPELKDKRVMVIGAGGAARAVLSVLVDEVNSVTVINRTVPTGVSLAKEFNCRYGGKIEDLTTETPDIIVNTTSVGLEGREEPKLVPDDFLESDMVIFDIVYRREGETQLIQKSKAAGAMTINGKAMLLEQGILQFELWTGQPAPREIMVQALSA